MLISQPNRFEMTARQLFRCALITASVHRANRMDDMFCSEASTGRNHSLSRGQATNLAHNLPALGEYGGSTCAANGSIDSASAQER